MSSAPAKPKIIFMVMLDDADYNDFGYYSIDAVTPNIDSIAKSGVRLSRYYAGSAICSPSRAAMLTGQSPIRYGLNYLWGNKPEDVKGDFYYGERGLPDEDPTMADGLKAEGYRTFFVGKWHIGTSQAKFLPGAKGFDRFTVQIGDDPASGSYRAITETGRTAVTTEWQSKHAADQIIAFMDQGLAAGDNVFVNWWPPEPHQVSSATGQAYFYVPPTFDRAAFDRDAGGKSINLSTDRGKVVSMLYAFDAQFGRVLDYIKQKNLYDDSLIVVTSDNGGMRLVLSPTRELQEAKGSVFEGGLRVPFAASWPKRFAAGTHSSVPVSAFDIYPTLLGLIGGPVPSNIEGKNLTSVLLNGTGGRGPLYFGLRLTQHRQREDERYYDVMTLIDGCDKVIVWFTQKHYYDLCKDPNERNNLANSNPTRLNSLLAALRANRARVSRYTGLATLSSAAVLPASERLNAHHDDLSVYATVNLSNVPGGAYNLYRRGDGVSLGIENGRFVASVTGVADATRAPPYRTVTLDAPIPVDGKSHRLGFVIRGYFAAASTLSLYVDGQLKSRLLAPLNVTLNAGTSVMAVKSENTSATVGANGLTFSDVQVLTTAIEPDEF